VRACGNTTSSKREADANKDSIRRIDDKVEGNCDFPGLRSSNIRVVDAAMIPSTPARPAKTRNVVLAFLIGLVGGIGLA